MGNWGGGNSVGCLYRVMGHEVKRAGHGSQIKKGDLLLCDRHSGDCFYGYAKVKWSRAGFLSVRGEASAYACSIGVVIPNRDYHLLMAGERIPMSKAEYDALIGRLDEEEERELERAKRIEERLVGER